MAADGLSSRQSRFDPAQTMTRLEAAVRARGLTVFARVDHARGLRRPDWRCDRRTC